MGRLDHRFLEVQIDTIRITGVRFPGLRVQAKAVKTLKKEPNTCDVTITNLSPEHRAALTKVKSPVVTLRAGYTDDQTQLFYGQAVHVKHERDGADILTTVSTTDGGDKFQAARVHQSFGPRARTGDVLRALVKALGLKPGNVDVVAKKLNAGKAADLYVGGVTLSGHAPHELETLCRSAGLEWSIQDGSVQILDLGKAEQGFAIVLDPELLIGTPSVSSKNIVEGMTFIQKDFLPGRQIHVSHPFVSGDFRLEKCSYSLDSHAEDWFVSFEAKGPPPKK